ncbi:hypothetical protein MTR67_038745 [Solanum verrucosum]|uniref:Uncharacterized protein n=1 Tax=Solanum verrucosum TaxID=315347 RepID=A0AAF0UGJ4_SOLVR|nr:hypothetical protein MTR67_038745 [Solanum verrucosum]
MRTHPKLEISLANSSHKTENPDCRTLHLGKCKQECYTYPKPQGGNSGGSSMLTCTRCGKKYDGKCLAGMDGCFNFGKSGHNMNDYLLLVITL